MKFHLVFTIFSVWVCCCFAVPAQMSSYRSFGGSELESRFRKSPVVNFNTLYRNSVHENVSCSQEDVETTVKCACFVGWRLRDILNSENLLKECREGEGEDLAQLKDSCTAHLDEDHRLHAKTFLPYTKAVVDTCFPVLQLTRFRSELHYNVIRAEPSSPPRPGLFKKILEELEKIFPSFDIEGGFEFSFSFKGSADSDGNVDVEVTTEGNVDVDANVGN